MTTQADQRPDSGHTADSTPDEGYQRGLSTAGQVQMTAIGVGLFTNIP
ncbi:hypothetical protein [Streptomyces yanii]|uniref:Amino acid permease n=1 Tax=Streptomyces yanii TaxID=78510 RepID=A0ABV5R2D2_9ACTN